MGFEAIADLHVTKDCNTCACMVFCQILALSTHKFCDSTNDKISSSHILFWDCSMSHVKTNIYFLLKYCCDITPLRTRK